MQNLKFAVLLCVVFFKQKTAYEMRISDWSSDVCSSDLQHGGPENKLLASVELAGCRMHALLQYPAAGCQPFQVDHPRDVVAHPQQEDYHHADHEGEGQEVVHVLTGERDRREDIRPKNRQRSEEHTSELQSLMRNSYAVFCLKKKKTQKQP